MAIVMVMMLTTIMLIFIAMGLSMVTNSMKDSSKQFARQAQVSNIARAGLQDAIGWFKRQATQPVRNNTGTSPLPYTCGDEAFNPIHNNNPLLSDTDDTSSNHDLYKDIHLSGNLYGRYVIKRQPCTASSPDPHSVHDYSDEKGKGADGEGIIWYVESQGILYQRSDFGQTNGIYNLGPSDLPNRMIQTTSAAVEIQRLKIDPPAYPVTITASSGSTTSTVNNLCNILGDSTAVLGGFYRYNTTVSGTPRCSLSTGSCVPAPPSGAKWQSTDVVFGVTQAELKALSDYIYSTVSNVPKVLPQAIHYLDGGGSTTFTFTSAKPLTGSGLLYVDGNLTLSDGASSAFNGVIYVTGTLSVGNGNSLGGAVLAKQLSCQPGSGLAVIEYNGKIVQNIRNTLGLYHENALTFRIN